MPRRVSLPGAAELFRPTSASDEPDPDAPAGADSAAAAAASSETGPPGETGPPSETGPLGETVPGDPSRGSGRIRHEEKITVYVSRDELLALERARLTLRADHARAVDRGRIVREAIAAVLEDLDRRGPDSELVRRLTAT